MTTRPAPHDHLLVARGEAVRLRLKAPDDFPNDFSWARDPELAHLNNRAVTEESYAQYVARLRNELAFVNPRERTFAIEDAGGQHVGNLMYYNVSAAGDQAEIGITIGSPAHRARGLGREAVVLLLRHLFETTSFRAVTLHTLASNEPALRCFRACGFEDLGLVESNGVNLVQMAVRREYWLMHDAEGRFTRQA